MTSQHEYYINLALKQILENTMGKKYNDDISNSYYVDEINRYKIDVTDIEIKQLANKLKDRDYIIKKNFLLDKIKSQKTVQLFKINYAGHLESWKLESINKIKKIDGDTLILDNNQILNLSVENSYYANDNYRVLLY